MQGDAEINNFFRMKWSGLLRRELQEEEQSRKPKITNIAWETTMECVFVKTSQVW